MQKRARKRLGWAIALVVIAGLVAGFLWLRQQQLATTDQPEVLRTGQVAQGDLLISVSSSGTVAMRRTTRVVARTAGRIAQVLVSPQERVTEGQILARSDQGDLQRAVQQAEIAVEQARLALEVAQKPADPDEIRLAQVSVGSAAEALELARIGTETAEVDAAALVVQAQRQREQAYIRYRDAADGDAKERARKAFEDAEAQERIAQLNADVTRKSANAQYQAALINYAQATERLTTLTDGVDEDTVEQRTLDLEQAELRLEQARRAVEETEIRAPHTGLVATVDTAQDATPFAGDLLFTILDDSEVYVDTTVDEIDIGSIVVGQQASIVADAYPEITLTGVVESIAPSAISIGGLVTYGVRIELTTLEGARLLDGMAVTAQIVTDTYEDLVLVPVWAVRRDQTTGETYSLRVDGAAVTRVPVQIGRSNESYAEVLDGLAANDTVALVATERDLFSFAGQAEPPWARD